MPTLIDRLLGALFALFIWWINFYATAVTVWAYFTHPKPKGNPMGKILKYAIWLALLGWIALTLFGCKPDGKLAYSDPATIEVKTRGNRGTGWHIGNGLIVTAGHVVSRDGEYWAKTESGRVHPVEILWKAVGYDIALLKITDKKFDLAKANIECRDPRVGDKVRAVGYPLMFGRFESWGWVASVDIRKFQIWKEVFAVNVAGGPGSSGGPIFNERGNVIGMTVAGPDRQGSDLIFAVPGSTMCKVLARG